MSNFKDFVKSGQKKLITNVSSSQELRTRISSSLTSATLSISSSDSDRFGNEVVKMANSDEVLTELSQSIGDPMEMENEDEFVERAKSALATILKRKLMK